MDQAEGFGVPSKEDRVCQLKWPLYGSFMLAHGLQDNGIKCMVHLRLHIV
jgi:hypothetical protein